MKLNVSIVITEEKKGRKGKGKGKSVVRAKGEQVIATSTSSNTSWIIISIRISLWTSSFKDLRICGGLARLRVTKVTGAAVSWRIECRTSTLASHNSSVVMRSNLKSHRTHHVQITYTSRIATFPYKNVKKIQSLKMPRSFFVGVRSRVVFKI